MDETKRRIAHILAARPRTACDLSRMLSTRRIDVMHALGALQQDGCAEMMPPACPGGHFRFKLTCAGKVRYVCG